MNNVMYLAIGEEAARGTAESSTVGFIPTLAPVWPRMEFDERPRAEFRGEEAARGNRAMIRYGRKWSGSIEMPFFTEGGTVAGIVGTLLKHFFGDVTTVQNGSTGQYAHMMYDVADPFATAALGTKALTLNVNLNEGGTTKNHAFVGGRVKSLSFEQAPGQHLKLVAELMGQFKEASGTAIASPAFPAENLRCDFNNLKFYTGTITRTGSAPNFTQFAFGSATQISPDKLSIKLENGMEDVTRLSGLDYPDKTRMGKFKVSLEFTIDWADPSSGFSSVDDFNTWLASASSTNFFAHWDTDTQAGSGDDHGLYIDMPVMQRMGGEPNYSLDKDPMITLKYEGLFDATTCQYLIGLMLKNTASAV